MAVIIKEKGFYYQKNALLKIDLFNWVTPIAYANEYGISKQRVNYLIKTNKIKSIYIKELNLRLVSKDPYLSWGRED